MPLVEEGTTDYLIDVFIQDISASGKGLEGLLYSTATLALAYHRVNAGAAVDVTLADMTVGTWVSGGFKEVDAIKMPGIYQIGVPDAVFAATFTGATLFLVGPPALFMAPVRLELLQATAASTLTFDTPDCGDIHTAGFP